MKVLILAGGTGTRLWPLSRKETPKQFIKLPQTKQSLFQMTLNRARKLVNDKDIHIIVREETKYLAQQQIREIGLEISEENFVIQYENRNTLPIVYFAVTQIGINHTYLMLPSDHIIPEKQIKKLEDGIKSGLRLCNNYLIVFGITPKSPHTGYGYINPGEMINNGVYKVEEFKEKPNRETAIQYIQKGYLWNSGMLLFSGKIFAQEVERYEPEIVSTFKRFTSPKEAFRQVKSISIDYGVLEKTRNIGVVKLDIKWSDVGDFKSLLKELGNPPDTNKILMNSANVLTLSMSNNKKSICLIGVDNIGVIDTPDAILVTDLDKSQDVRKLYEKVEEKLPSLTHSWREYRPWGNFQVLVDSNEFKIKKLTLLPKKRTSYQSHKHRAETWIILHGTAKIRLDDREVIAKEGDVVQIKKEQKHRLMNYSDKEPLEVIEIQTGDYFGEDDITRYEDDWGRE